MSQALHIGLMVPINNTTFAQEVLSWMPPGSRATTPGAQFLDFRISTYAPKAYVHTHVHPNKEQIYFFLEGEGVLELGAEKKVVRPNQFAFIPPHLPHGLHNTGHGQLVFIVITTVTDRA